jgi:hypothetical protein
MQNQLAGFVSRIGKTESVDDIVEPPFEKHEQVLSGNAFLLIRLFKGVPELILKKPIDSPDLLFLPELGPVIRELFSRLAMLPWRIISAIHGALFRIAALSFEKEFKVFSST